MATDRKHFDGLRKFYACNTDFLSLIFKYYGTFLMSVQIMEVIQVMKSSLFSQNRMRPEKSQ